MYSRIAFASSTLVFHFFRFSSSICIEDPPPTRQRVPQPRELSATVENEAIATACIAAVIATEGTAARIGDILTGSSDIWWGSWCESACGEEHA